jgi:hypothetical protein
VSCQNCPMGQQRRTLATWLFAATKKRLASYITCCWHYMTKAVIAYLNRPKQDKSQGTVHSWLERESKSGRMWIKKVKPAREGNQLMK